MLLLVVLPHAPVERVRLPVVAEHRLASVHRALGHLPEEALERQHGLAPSLVAEPHVGRVDAPVGRRVEVGHDDGAEVGRVGQQGVTAEAPERAVVVLRPLLDDGRLEGVDGSGRLNLLRLLDIDPGDLLQLLDVVALEDVVAVGEVSRGQSLLVLGLPVPLHARNSLQKLVVGASGVQIYMYIPM